MALAWLGFGPSLEDQLFNLRFTSKQLKKDADKLEKQMEANKLKIKKCMEKGDNESAKVYAESAIRDKNGYLNYLRLSSRLEAVSQRIQTAMKMKTLTKDMAKVVDSLSSVSKSMDVEKITRVMDKFEQQFEKLDLTTQTMNSALTSSTSSTIPETQVDTLMQQVADEHGLEVQIGLADAPIGKKDKVKESEKKEINEEKDELEARLGRLSAQ